MQASVVTLLVYPLSPSMHDLSDWKPAEQADPVKTARSHVDMALEIAAHDPVVPRDSFLWLPTPAPAQWTRIQSAAEHVLTRIQFLEASTAAAERRGKGTPALWL